VRKFFVFSQVIHVPCFGGVEEAKSLLMMLTPSQPLIAIAASRISVILFDNQKKAHRLFVGAAGATSWDHNRMAIVEISNDKLTRLLEFTNK